MLCPVEKGERAILLNIGTDLMVSAVPLPLQTLLGANSGRRQCWALFSVAEEDKTTNTIRLVARCRQRRFLPHSIIRCKLLLRAGGEVYYGGILTPSPLHLNPIVKVCKHYTVTLLSNSVLIFPSELVQQQRAT